MPSPENITLQVAVNGGAPQTGAVQVTYGDSLVLSLADPSGVKHVEYRIWEYPDGFTVPAGWTEVTDDDGVTYYRYTAANGSAAPAITMPSAPSLLWGKYFFSAKANNGLRNGAAAPDLLDDRTAVFIPSQTGVKDVGFGETTQFDGHRQWGGSLKAMIREVDNAVATGLPFPLSVANITALAAASTGGSATIRYVQGRSTVGDGGEGWFAWRSGDYSAAVSDDPQEGIYVAPDTDPSGASGAWVRVWTGPVNVAWWGCSPSASAASNTTAINAAIAFLATSLSSSLIDHTLVFPEGRIEVTSIDLTEWFAYNLKLYLHGTVLVGATADKAVVDATGSRYIEFHGGHITNKTGIVPRDGLQLGPKGTETCGNVKMWGLRIDGQFTRAAYTNLGSETTYDFACTFINRYDNASAYAAVFDGVSTYLPISDYATVTRVAGTGVSFTVVHHYSSHFRRDDVTTGSAVYLAGAADHTFDRGCYFLAYGVGAAYAVLYGTATYRSTQLAICGSFEGTPSYGLEFTGDGTNTALENFKIDTLVPRCQTAWLHKTGLGTLRLSMVKWDIHDLYEAGALFFDGASLVSIDGEIATREAAKLNLGGLASFTGTLRVDDFTALASRPAAGVWQLFDTTNADVIFGGDSLRIYDQAIRTESASTNKGQNILAKGTGSVTMGNGERSDALSVEASVNATQLRVIMNSANPRFVAAGTPTDIDISLEPKGAGKVKMGTHAAIGAETVTGYIEIKDSAGTVRKIAVVS